jgi:hypothetical protein
VILLRLEDERTENKISVLKHLLEKYEKSIPGSFIVVTETTVRSSFAPKTPPPAGKPGACGMRGARTGARTYHKWDKLIYYQYLNNTDSY